MRVLLREENAVSVAEKNADKNTHITMAIILGTKSEFIIDYSLIFYLSLGDAA